MKALAAMGLNVLFNGARDAADQEQHREVPAILTEEGIQLIRDRGWEVKVINDLTETARERQDDVFPDSNLLAGVKSAADLARVFAGADAAAASAPGTITTEAAAPPDYQKYMNADLVEDAIKLLAVVHPRWATLIKLPFQSVELKRTSHALRIRAGSRQKRHGVLFLGSMHAREWAGSDICVNFAHALLLAYFKENQPLRIGNKTFSYEQIRAIMENLDIFVFPDVNPDGKIYTQTAQANVPGLDQSNWWRKNRRPSKDPAVDRFGVDLNRNFNFLWDEKISSSENVSNDTYRGAEPHSEPETQNVLYLFKTYPHIRYFIDFHTYGNKILYQWGDDDNQNVNVNLNWAVKKNPKKSSPVDYRGQTECHHDKGATKEQIDAYKEFISTLDENTMKNWANRMRDTMEEVSEADMPQAAPYEVQQAMELYPTGGTVTDYAFAKNPLNKIYSYTFEVGDRFVQRFDVRNQLVAPFRSMRGIIDDNNAAMLELCWSTLSDLYIRDNEKDTGDVPSKGVAWNSPDVWVRNREDDGAEHQQPIRGRDNYVYVRVNNRGIAEAKKAVVRVYVARAHGGFSYPKDFAPVNAERDIPIDPKKGGTYLLGEAEIDLIKPGENKVTHIKWRALLSPPKNWHPCLLVEVAPNDGPSASNAYVNGNNNLAQKNVVVVDAKPGATANLTFQIAERVEPTPAPGVLVGAAAARLKRGQRKSAPEQPTAAGSVVVKRIKGPTRLGLFLDVKDETMMRTLRRSTTVKIGAGTKKASKQARKTTGKASRPAGQVSGFDSVKEKGKPVLALSGQKLGRVPLAAKQEKKKRNEMSLKVVVPKDAKKGERYEIQIEQHDAKKRAMGGIIFEVRVV